jgi:homogentisate 1,2-dioxygenase
MVAPESTFHYTDTGSSSPTRDGDPYEYMSGFGNRFQSEVIPGTLPQGQNQPRAPKYGLYTEGLTYSAFVAPRQHNISTFTYRVRPSLVHGKCEVSYRDQLTPVRQIRTLRASCGVKLPHIESSTDSCRRVRIHSFPHPDSGDRLH